MSASVVEHPLVHHHLTRLRSTAVGHAEFRSLVNKLASFLAIESTKELTTAAQVVETPLCETTGRKLNQSVALVPILRAGLGMVDPILELVPDAQVWHLGLYRDESTAQPVEYYNKLPADRETDVAFILDPMLATGGSAKLACRTLRDWGVANISLLSLIAAPEGIAALEEEFPELHIFACSIDDRLDERKFIVPGLGDAGDRIFNTEIN